jgi:hypothetical protein
MADALTSDEVARLTMARCLVARKEAELRAAKAALDLCLIDVQEVYGLGQGDALTPTGEIRRAGVAD